MLLDKNLFRLGREFAAHYRTIADEVARLPTEMFVDWIDRGAYSDGWKVVLLLVDNVPDGVAYDFAHSRRLLPRTWELVRAQPEVITAAVSRLLPGCYVFPHTDTVQPDVYRYHLCLDVQTGSRMRGEHMHVDCRDGLDYVFDHRVEHDSRNDSDRPRDVLVLDFVAGEDERAALARWRRERFGG